MTTTSNTLATETSDILEQEISTTEACSLPVNTEEDLVTQVTRKGKSLWEKMLQKVEVENSEGNKEVFNRLFISKAFGVDQSQVQYLFHRVGKKNPIIIKIGQLKKYSHKYLRVSINGNSYKQLNSNIAFIPNKEEKLWFISNDLLDAIIKNYESISYDWMKDRTEIDVTGLLDSETGYVNKEVLKSSNTYLITNRKGFKFGIIESFIGRKQMRIVAHNQQRKCIVDNKNYTLVEYKGSKFFIDLSMFE